MAFFGGGLIGIAASGMLFTNGRIMGVSGILAGLLTPQKGNIGWRVAFIIGILFASFFLFKTNLLVFETLPLRSDLLIALGGLLVGFGTIFGNGCTSGHGVCGISRFSMRSVLATFVFIIIGILATYLLNNFLLESL
jgi:uncharacterized membrane protein YedE/YeeE